MNKKKLVKTKPFVKTVSSRFLKLLLANDSNQGFRESWELESSVLPQIQIRLKNVHHDHKTWKRKRTHDEFESDIQSYNKI